KAIEAIGTDEAPKVMAQMRATPVNDFFAKNGKIRIDGRMVHDMYLFEVKKPEESKGEWDLYKLLATVPGDEAFRPLDKGGCQLQIELRDCGEAEMAERFCGVLGRRGCRLVPGIVAGADKFDNLGDALSHDVPPVGQGAGCSCHHSA